MTGNKAPEHFVNIRKHENCEECLRIYQHDDEIKEICGLHKFTLPLKPSHYRCDDFIAYDEEVVGK